MGALINLQGVDNFHKVSDFLYRSAQPTSEGMKNLKEFGIKTIVNLRTFHSDRDEIGTLNLNYYHIYMKTWHPEFEDAVKFLKIVTDKTNVPSLVHCLHGSDRTGTMVAVYRIVVQNWSKQCAVQEMVHGNYGFHAIWIDLPYWLKYLDIESLRIKIGRQK